VSRARLIAILCTSLAALPVTSNAQDGTTISLTISPSFVDFGAWGGSFGAAVVQLSIRRDFTRSIGG
jgi:hypothetical protein